MSCDDRAELDAAEFWEKAWHRKSQLSLKHPEYIEYVLYVFLQTLPKSQWKIIVFTIL